MSCTERRLPFQPVVALTLEEQLTAAIAKRNIPRVKLEADENGFAIVDKNKHPEIYDWAQALAFRASISYVRDKSPFFVCSGGYMQMRISFEAIKFQ